MLGLILMVALGFLFLFLGWRIWKKGQISLLHSYHYKKVSESDKKPYTEEIGKGLIFIGVGMLVTGTINFLTDTLYGWIFFGISLIGGFTTMYMAQKKYNGGIF